MMQVASLTLAERTSLYDDETRTELITTITDPDGNEIELTWLNPEQFDNDKAKQLELKFLEIMEIIGSDIERYN